MKLFRQISRNKTRRQQVGVVALLALGILCLVRMLGPNLQDSKDEIIGELNQENDLQSPQPLYTSEPPPKCERNVSASNIAGFYGLPIHIQDFLFYRHCRYFPMLQNVPDKCGGPQNSKHVFLLLVIKSSPANYEQREVLRKTWAAERLQNGKWIRTVFLSGTSGDSYQKLRLNKLLQLENHEHQDILQWDFKDSLYNLTLKQVLFMEWLERWCPKAQFLLNGDDDIFANTNNIVEYLEGLDGEDGSKHLFIGRMAFYLSPIRTKDSKYYIPVQVQESDRYPPYCFGCGFLLSRFTARSIYNTSHSIPLMPIDDVYIGMCLEKAGLKPESHMGVRTHVLSVPSQNIDSFDPCYYRDILLVHRFLPYETFIMWQEIHRDDLECGKVL
ncbi:N-acetyllactosaminide beta-1,3-N-acetylglucosaminyltransferase 3-like [Brachyhypopomus gauderio]|uniref:N-acetyllactosaminide beta-1,3-N-acetylglucosaminyltransferase 3-like n=1 Tax=Brachyhypopomus gauderio TaxID=698409 RepID=UPI004040F43D